MPKELIRHLFDVAAAAVRYDGRTWAVPFGMDTTALVRNVDLVAQAPSSFAEVVETGQALTDAGRTQVPLVQEVGLNGDLRYAYPYFAASAEGIFARLPDGGYDGTRLLITSPAWVRGGERLRRLAREGILTTDIDARNSGALFDSGDSAWFVTGSWSPSRAGDAGIETRVSPLPPFADGSRPRPFVDVAVLMVSARTQRPDLARRVALECGGAPAVQVSLATSAHRPPARADAVATAAREAPDLAVWARAAERGDPVPNVPQMDAVWGPLAQAEADIIRGQDPAAALQEAAHRIRAADTGGTAVPR